MKTVKNLIIGFGKGGKTLAGYMASKKESVIIVEESDKMFGGTCINVACIPSKAMEYSGRMVKATTGSFPEQIERYKKAVQEKNNLISLLRQKNYEKAVNAGVEVIVGKASFIDTCHVNVLLKNGVEEVIEAERIFINTGSRPFIPPIKGLKESRYSYLSEDLLSLEKLPSHLVIIGAGYIGMEFASIFRNFGSSVTIIQDGEVFLPREDEEIASSVLDSFKRRGIQIIQSATVEAVDDKEDCATLTLKTKDSTINLDSDAILIATGRRPNVDGLNLDRAKVNLTERGAVKTNEHLETSTPDIYALGDVVGGLQFTYISLDDSRILKSTIYGDGSRTTKNRENIPYSVFIDPPFSRVGMSESEAIKAGYEVKIARIPSSIIPKAKILHENDDLLKAVIDKNTDLILGAHLFMANSEETINLIKLAMDMKVPYTTLRDNIYTHPTMSEALNDLFSNIS